MSTLLTLARAVHFGSCLILQGFFAVQLMVLLPAVARVGGNVSAGRERIERLFRRWLFLCLGLAGVSGFLWLWLSIAGMSGSTLRGSLQPELFQMVLTQTQPGHVWLVRVGIGGLIGAVLLLPRGTGRTVLGALSAVALTVSLAWLGHAGASEGASQNVQLAADLLHLFAAGVWPAGLVPLAIYLHTAFRTPALEALRVACVATRRFSNLSLVMVGLLAASGIANSYFLVGSFRLLAVTDYGRLLLLKLILFAAMVAIGAWNLLILKRELAAKPPMVVLNVMEAVTLTRIKRNVLIEIALGTLVVLVVGLLGILPPASHP